MLATPLGVSPIRGAAMVSAAAHYYIQLGHAVCNLAIKVQEKPLFKGQKCI